MRITREAFMVIALVAILAFFAWQAPVFLSARNLSLLSIELAVTATLALGMLLVLLPGHIDLSAGSGVGLAGAVAAVLITWHGMPAPLALVVAVVATVAVWALIGALVIVERVPAFIITLGGLLVFRRAPPARCCWRAAARAMPIHCSRRTSCHPSLAGCWARCWSRCW